MGREPAGSAAHLLGPRGAAAALGPGGGEGCQGCRGSQPGGPGRRPRAGAEERREAQGPPPRPLCPCAPPPGPAVAGGGRWPVAEAAPGPLGTALSIDTNLPLPTPNGKKKKKKYSVDREGGRAVGCGLRPHMRFTYAEKERGGKERPGVCPSRGNQPSAGGEDGTNRLHRGILRNVNLGDRWMESHVPCH